MEELHIPETTDGDFSKSPVPFCSNDMITNEAGISEGQMGVVTHDVELLTGRNHWKWKTCWKSISMYGRRM